MQSKLEYSEYNKKSIAVRGNRERYQDIIKGLGGRWNSRMRGGEGWLVPISKKEDIDNIISSLKEEDEEFYEVKSKIYESEPEDLETIKSNAKNHKEQKKYHREQSENENESEEESSNSEEEEDKFKENYNFEEDNDSEDDELMDSTISDLLDKQAFAKYARNDKEVELDVHNTEDLLRDKTIIPLLGVFNYCLTDLTLTCFFKCTPSETS